MMAISLNNSDWDSKQIIQNNRKLIQVKPHSHGTRVISQRIKGRIFSGLIDKYTQKQPKIRDYFVKWHAKTKADTIKSQVLLKILTQQRISQFTFFYRLKAHCQLSLDENIKQNNEAISSEGSHNQVNKQAKQQVSIEKSQKINKQNLNLNKANEKQKNKQIPKKLDDKYKQKDNKKQNKLGFALNDLRGHLRCISQQPSIPMSSQRQFSQNDALQNLDRRLDLLNQRMKVSSLRACELIMRKASQRLKMEIFRRFLKKQ